MESCARPGVAVLLADVEDYAAVRCELRGAAVGDGEDDVGRRGVYGLTE